MATRAPARGDSLPFATTTAVTGPGAMTPEREISTASERKINRGTYGSRSLRIGSTGAAPLDPLHWGRQAGLRLQASGSSGLHQPLPYTVHLAHQDVEVFPSAAVIGMCDVQNVLASDNRARWRGDALFLQLDKNLLVERI